MFLNNKDNKTLSSYSVSDYTKGLIITLFSDNGQETFNAVLIEDNKIANSVIDLLTNLFSYDNIGYNVCNILVQPTNIFGAEEVYKVSIEELITEFTQVIYSRLEDEDVRSDNNMHLQLLYLLDKLTQLQRNEI